MKLKLNKLKNDSQEIISNLQATVDSLITIAFEYQTENEKLMAEIERLKAEAECADGYADALVEKTKSETIKEFEEKITEIFKRYAHIHSFAEAARKDSIEAFDGTEIEMQSVWDVFTLKEHELVEYEEMDRLQSNIEVIEKERLLTELEKDFRLLVKEMVGDDK